MRPIVALVPVASLLLGMILVGCQNGMQGESPEGMATPGESLTLTDFVAPDWMVKDRPEMVESLKGVKVAHDIEYVPGYSKLPLANPSAMHEKALEYINKGGKTRAFDIYFPRQVTEKMPVVVWFHGGPNYGSKDGWCPALVLLSHGYILVNANYRLRGEASEMLGTVKDGKAVIRWLRAHAGEYHIDPDHVGIWGHSAGAGLVGWIGATNDEPTLEGTEGNLEFSSHVQAACVWSGGAPPLSSTRPTPLKYVDRTKSAPYLIMHGTKDTVVRIENDETLAAGLIQAGVECSFIPVPGAGHGFGGPNLERQVIAFFDRHLKSGSAAGVMAPTELDR